MLGEQSHGSVVSPTYLVCFDEIGAFLLAVHDDAAPKRGQLDTCNSDARRIDHCLRRDLRPCGPVSFHPRPHPLHNSLPRPASRSILSLSLALADAAAYIQGICHVPVVPGLSCGWACAARLDALRRAAWSPGGYQRRTLLGLGSHRRTAWTTTRKTWKKIN
jgi:hypothetical protein